MLLLFQTSIPPSAVLQYDRLQDEMPGEAAESKLVYERYGAGPDVLIQLRSERMKGSVSFDHTSLRPVEGFWSPPRYPSAATRASVDSRCPRTRSLDHRSAAYFFAVAPSTNRSPDLRF